MFKLRTATESDVPALRELIDASVRGLNADLYSPAQVESGLRYVFGPDTQLIADGTYYVIENGESIVAAGGWSGRRTLFGGDQHKTAETDTLLDPATDAAKIRAFFVHPSAARRGLARQLYEQCAAAARMRGFSSLELGSTLPGEPLYRSLGFEAHERIDVPLPDGVKLPVIRMSRRLEKPIATYGLTHLALAVADVDRAFEFYSRVFGMVAVYRDTAFLQAQTPGTRDILVFEKSDRATGETGGIAHFGFCLTDPAGIEHAAERITAAGGTVVEQGEFCPGEPYIFARDRDGYLIEVAYESD